MEQELLMDVYSFLVSSYLVGMLLLWMHTKFPCSFGGNVPIMDAYKVSLFSYLVVMFLLWMHTKFSCVLLLGGNVPIMDAYIVF